MRTHHEIDKDDLWTPIAALCLLVVFCVGAIGYGYVAVLTHLVGPPTAGADLLGYLEPAHMNASLAAAGVMTACVLPGVVLWRTLRSGNKRAALYGLLLTAGLSIGAPRLIGASPASVPAGESRAN